MECFLPLSLSCIEVFCLDRRLCSSYYSFLILNSFCIYDFPIQKFFLRCSHLPECIVPFIYRILLFIIAFLYRRFLSTTFLFTITRFFHNKSVFLYRIFPIQKFSCVCFLHIMNVFYTGFRLFWMILSVKSHFHIKHPHFYHFFFKHFASNTNPKPQYIVSK